jgi:deoxyribodipyrimidine photolyase-related protein
MQGYGSDVSVDSRRWCFADQLGAAGGAYINRMSDYCGQCRYRPTERVGDRACPFTGGYWWFLDRNAQHLANNQRMNQSLAGLRRLNNLDDVVEQRRRLGGHAP